jgi:homoserine kinase
MSAHADSSFQPQSVTVRLPGSSANCGSGFDCLAIALSIFNRVTVSRLAPSTQYDSSACAWSAVPETASDVLAQDMALSAALAFGDAAHLHGFSFKFHIQGEVPVARGVGSSVTVIGGVLAALNAISSSPLSRHQLIAAAARVEGHADNAAAAFLGGFCVAHCEDSYVDAIRIPVPTTLRFILASPDVELLTKDARGCLPSSLPYSHAVKSISSCAYVVAAFATGDYQRLRAPVSDFMHQPYRLPLIPGGRHAISAGVSAGAYTGWLSGSGSSVLCVCDAAVADNVAEGMRAAFLAQHVSCVVRNLAADNDGAVVES